MDISYGIKVQESDDPYISLAEESLDGLNEAAIVGTFWVDLFPVLKYVPSWFPGAGFQKKAAHWRELNTTMSEKPFRYVQEQLVGEPFSRAHELVYMVILQKIGKAAPSVAATLIERLPDEDDPQRPMEERVAQDVAGVVYAGLWSCKWTPNHGRPADYFIAILSAGADTVSERGEMLSMVLLTASLDSVNCASTILGDGTISGSPEKSTSRNRRCGGPTSPPRF